MRIVVNEIDRIPKQ